MHTDILEEKRNCNAVYQGGWLLTIRILFIYHQMMTDSSAGEDQQCNAAKLLEVTILQCHGLMDQVLYLNNSEIQCISRGCCGVTVIALDF